METPHENELRAIRFCRTNSEMLEKQKTVSLKKIMSDNNFLLKGWIRSLQGIGIHSLDPQSQQESDDIFGTGDGFGGHIYGDNCSKITG